MIPKPVSTHSWASPRTPWGRAAGGFGPPAAAGRRTARLRGPAAARGPAGLGGRRTRDGRRRRRRRHRARRTLPSKGADALGSARRTVKSQVVLSAALCCAGRLDTAREVADAAFAETARFGLIPLRWALGCLLADIGSTTHSAPQVAAIRDDAAGYSATRRRRVVASLSRFTPSRSLVFI